MSHCQLPRWATASARITMACWFVSSFCCCSMLASRALKLLINKPISSWRETRSGASVCPPWTWPASTLTVSSKGCSWRRSSHQVKTAAASVSSRVVRAMRHFMVRIGAKASSVGSTTANTQLAGCRVMSEAKTSMPWGLRMTRVSSTPPIKASMSGLTPGAGSCSMMRLLSVAAMMRRWPGSTSR